MSDRHLSFSCLTSADEQLLPETGYQCPLLQKHKAKSRTFHTFVYFCHMIAPFALLPRIWHFYRDGFRQMTWGRTLWVIILIKLFVIFVVLRLFFFRPALAGMDEQQKGEAVGTALTR